MDNDENMIKDTSPVWAITGSTTSPLIFLHPPKPSFPALFFSLFLFKQWFEGDFHDQTEGRGGESGVSGRLKSIFVKIMLG